MSRFSIVQDLLSGLREDVLTAWPVDECYIGPPRQEKTAPYAVVDTGDINSDWFSGGGTSTNLLMDLQLKAYGLFAYPPASINVKSEQLSRAEEITAILEANEYYKGEGMMPIVSGVAFGTIDEKDQYEVEITFSIRVEALRG